VPGAADAILAALRDHGLQWHGDVLWQSTRTPDYQHTVDMLLAEGRAYRCDCSRKDVANMGGIYDGRCRDRKLGPDSNAAVRLNVSDLPAIQVQDAVQPDLRCDLAREVGDFVILRRDGLFAYQLAVVVDDADQGITRIVRGSDLYDSTPKQIALQHVLGLPQPDYAHIPVIENDLGQKLSKQSHAPALEANRALENLELALRFLGQPLPVQKPADTDALLRWAVEHWDLSSIPRRSGIPASRLGC
jgi:glutamyl-Q tRNA(Asp) synthetase